MTLHLALMNTENQFSEILLARNLLIALKPQSVYQNPVKCMVNVKALSSPPSGLNSILDTPGGSLIERGLIREGVLIYKIN